MLTGRSSDYVAMVNEVVPELKDAHPGKLSSAQFPNLRNVIYIPPPSDPDSEPPAGMWLARSPRKGPGNQRGRMGATAGRLYPDDVVNIQYTSGTTGEP